MTTTLIRHPFRTAIVAIAIGTSLMVPSLVRAQSGCTAVEYGSTMRYRPNITGPSEDALLVQYTPGLPAPFTMKYRANSSDPGIGIAWTAEGYSDAGWLDGHYGVGYETAAAAPRATDILRTTVASGTFSVYTRARFEIADVTAVRTLLIGADYDDGYIAWINGVEVARSAEMPAGSPAWNTNAGLHESSNGGAGGTTPAYGTLLDISVSGIPLLHNGTNVLAIGVWNSAAATSSDLVLIPRLSIGYDWTRLAYSDVSWTTGAYGVGYDGVALPNALALIGAGATVPTGTLSVYSRATFNVASPAVVTALSLGADYDDGYIAWINGVEVYRSPEMGAGAPAYNTSAALHESSNAATPNYGTAIDISAAGIPALAAGTNVLAVGVWNNASTSTDLVVVPRLTVNAADPCDGIDNDCDGSTDEDFVVGVATCGVGACSATAPTACVGGAVVSNCTPGTPAADDATCNGIDEDCNGTADEDYVASVTGCGLGPCATTGQLICVGGATVDTCTPGTGAANDATCDGVDDDCDGLLDEDYAGVLASCGTGACAATGTTTCVGGVVQPNCTPGTPAADDATCNGIDEDCNGAADEDYVPVPTTCGVGGCASTGVTSCVGGTVVDSCIGGGGSLTDATCNGLDDDCDGQQDEEYVPVVTSCGLGVCASSGVTSCVSGSVQDSCAPGTPSPETCDNLDNDCDGTVDSFATTCGVEPCRAAGTCSAGVDSCVPGTPNPADVTCRTAHYLVAKAYSKPLPGGGSVLMWGFARDADGNLATDGGETPTVPGPMLAVPPGGASLTIHVRNDLSEPISLVIPGLNAALNPKWVDGAGLPVSDGSRPAGDYTSRARSFTTETDPGQIGTYNWPDPRPGTYLYQSGTRPAKQVQMGLYGALRMNDGPGEAYPGRTYDNEVVLLYHEIDPALHNAVQTGAYGTAAYPSTIDYRPQYFLINGEPYPGAAPVLDHGIRTNEQALVRLLNAGLQSRVPTFPGLRGSVVAEDGNPLPYARDQHSALLPAGKTADLLMSPARSGVYPVYDHRMALTNAADGPGGMLLHLNVSEPAGAPHATSDGYGLLEDQPLNLAAPGILGNDSDPDMDPLTAILVNGVPPATASSFSLGADGSLVYVPAANFNGSVSFTYQATDGVLNSNVATVILSVAAVNDTPLAVADAFSTDEGVPLDVAAPGVLVNDTDVDGEPLMAVLVPGGGPFHGSLVLNPDGSFRYTPAAGYSGSDQFTYVANDGTVDSAQAIVTLTVVPAPNQPPVANDDAASTRRNTARVIPVVANDTDADGTIDPTTVVITTQPRYGSVINNGNGTVTYTPRRNFTGSDAFAYTVRDNEGATSNVATVRVNVTR